MYDDELLDDALPEEPVIREHETAVRVRLYAQWLAKKAGRTYYTAADMLAAMKREYPKLLA